MDVSNNPCVFQSTVIFRSVSPDTHYSKVKREEVNLEKEGGGVGISIFFVKGYCYRVERKMETCQESCDDPDLRVPGESPFLLLYPRPWC